jgi:hypothetical protein
MNQMQLRIAAREAGELFYSTGQPCKYGHHARRYTSTGGCLECLHPGHTQKALDKFQAQVVQRYSLYTLIPKEATLQDKEELDRYLQRCLIAFDKTKGWPNLHTSALSWAEETGRPIREYKP